MPKIAPKFLLNFFLLLPLGLCAQLILQVSSIPSNTPNDSDIYLAGDFNNWAPDNADYILDELAGGIYEISLDIPAGNYEFKFTRGSWPTVEGTAAGTYRPNRQVSYSGGAQTETLIIEGWEDQSGSNRCFARWLLSIQEHVIGDYTSRLAPPRHEKEIPPGLCIRLASMAHLHC